MILRYIVGDTLIVTTRRVFVKSIDGVGEGDCIYKLDTAKLGPAWFLPQINTDSV